VDLFSEISPNWYNIDSSGNMVPVRNNGQSYENLTIVSYLHANNISVTPNVANIINGDWAGSAVGIILRDSARRSNNINSMVNLAVSKGYDGISLDYEDLKAGDRELFSLFVKDLASALHAEGKTLAVNVYGKTSEPGVWDGQQAQDWQALGQYSDQVRIMLYDYHWSTSPPGPIAPIGWTNDVLSFASTTIPQEKIIHGIPLYGYDWVGSSANSHMWAEIQNIISTYNPRVNWDSESASPWFEYVASGVRHEVWFEDSSSTDAKIDSTNSHNVPGVHFWRLGGEDPATWDIIRNKFQ